MTAPIVLTVLGVLAVALAFGVRVGLALYAVGFDSAWRFSAVTCRSTK